MQTGNRNCAAIIYAPDEAKYVSAKLVEDYAVKIFGIAPELFNGLQVELWFIMLRLLHITTIITHTNI